eukprot:CFRG7321T1
MEGDSQEHCSSKDKSSTSTFTSISSPPLLTSCSIPADEASLCVAKQSAKSASASYDSMIGTSTSPTSTTPTASTNRRSNASTNSQIFNNTQHKGVPIVRDTLCPSTPTCTLSGKSVYPLEPSYLLEHTNSTTAVINGEGSSFEPGSALNTTKTLGNEVNDFVAMKASDNTQSRIHRAESALGTDLNSTSEVDRFTSMSNLSKQADRNVNTMPCSSTMDTTNVGFPITAPNYIPVAGLHVCEPSSTGSVSFDPKTTNNMNGGLVSSMQGSSYGYINSHCGQNAASIKSTHNDVSATNRGVLTSMSLHGGDISMSNGKESTYSSHSQHQYTKIPSPHTQHPDMDVRSMPVLDRGVNASMNQVVNTLKAESCKHPMKVLAQDGGDSQFTSKSSLLLSKNPCALTERANKKISLKGIRNRPIQGGQEEFAALLLVASRTLDGTDMADIVESLGEQLDARNLLPYRQDFSGESHRYTYKEYIHMNSKVKATPSLKDILVSYQKHAMTKKFPRKASSLYGHLVRKHQTSKPLSYVRNCALQYVRGRHEEYAERSMLYELMDERFKVIGHAAPTFCCLFDRTGTRIITGADDFNVKVWDAKSGMLLRTLRGHIDVIVDISINADNTLLVSVCKQRQTIVWDLPTGKLLKVLHGHIGQTVHNVHLTPTPYPDNQYIISTGSDGTARFYKLIEGTFHESAVFEEAVTLKDQLVSSDASPGGVFFAAGSQGGHCYIYHLKRGDEPVKLADLEGHTAKVTTVKFNTMGASFATGSQDGTARIWRMENGIWTSCVLDVEPYLMFANPDVGFMTDPKEFGRGVFDAGNTERVNKHIASISPKQLNEYRQVSMVCFNSDDTMVITAVGDYTVKIWNASTKEHTHTLLGHIGLIYVLEPHPTDPNVVMTAGHDGRLILWDIVRGCCLKMLWNHDEAMQYNESFADGRFSPDGLSIAMTDTFGHVCLYDEKLREQRMAEPPPQQFFETDNRVDFPIVNSADGILLDGRSMLPPHDVPPGPLSSIEGLPLGQEYQTTAEKYADYWPKIETTVLQTIIANRTALAHYETQCFINQKKHMSDARRKKTTEASRDQQKKLASNKRLRDEEIKRLKQASKRNVHAMTTTVMRTNTRTFGRRGVHNGSTASNINASGARTTARTRRTVAPDDGDDDGDNETDTHSSEDAWSEGEEVSASELESSSIESSSEDEEDVVFDGSRNRPARKRKIGRSTGITNSTIATRASSSTLSRRRVIASSDSHSSSGKSESSSENSNSEVVDEDEYDSDYGDTYTGCRRNKRRESVVARAKPTRREQDMAKAKKRKQKQELREVEARRRQVNVRKHRPTRPDSNTQARPLLGRIIVGLSKWVSMTDPCWSPYCPQVGDVVAYFPEIHKQFIDTVRASEQHEISSLGRIPMNLADEQQAVKKCTVEEVTFVVGVPTICEVRLRVHEGRTDCRDGSSRINTSTSTEATSVSPLLSPSRTVMANRSGPDEPLYIKRERGATYLRFSYHDMDGVPDILVLYSRVTATYQNPVKVGDTVQSYFPHDKEWFKGILRRDNRIAGPSASVTTNFDVNGDVRAHCSSDYNAMFNMDVNPVNSLYIEWGEDSFTSMSPWDVEKAADGVPFNPLADPHQPLRLRTSECIQQTERARIIEGIKTLRGIEYAQNFVREVDFGSYPDYLQTVARPTCLNDIIARLTNNFYRGVDALIYDVRMVRLNCYLYNAEGSDIRVEVDKMAARLEHFILSRTALQDMDWDATVESETRAFNAGSESNQSKGKDKAEDTNPGAMPVSLPFDPSVGPSSIGASVKRKASIGSVNSISSPVKRIRTQRIRNRGRQADLTDTNSDDSASSGKPRKTTSRTLRLSQRASSPTATPLVQNVFPTETERDEERALMLTRKQKEKEELQQKKEIEENLQREREEAQRHSRQKRLYIRNIENDVEGVRMVVGSSTPSQTETHRYTESHAQNHIHSHEKTRNTSVKTVVARLRGGIPSAGDARWNKIPITALACIQAVLLNCLQSRNSFQYPVPASVRDYHAVIKTPMDLGTISENIKKGEYNELPGNYIRDVRLVIRNAKIYNAEGSDVYSAAEHVEYVFDRHLADVWSAAEDYIQLGASGIVFSNEYVLSIPDLVLTPYAMETVSLLHSELTSHPDVAFFFSRPVWEALQNDLELLVEYKMSVYMPMDLHNISACLLEGLIWNLREYASFVELSISNCLAFNDEHSTIHEKALAMSTVFRTRLTEVAHTLSRPVHKGRTSISEIRTLHTRIMQSEFALNFNEPVPKDLQEYHELIVEPMDFGTINDGLQRPKRQPDWQPPSLCEYMADCTLVFSNCLIYNDETSEIGKECLSLRAEWLNGCAELLNGHNLSEQDDLNISSSNNSSTRRSRL